MKNVIKILILAIILGLLIFSIVHFERKSADELDDLEYLMEDESFEEESMEESIDGVVPEIEEEVQ